MSACLRTALIESLSAPLGLGKSRLETLRMLLVGLIHGRTVNLSHIASQCHGPARYASKYRRLQRFFQHVRQPVIDRDAAADQARPPHHPHPRPVPARCAPAGEAGRQALGQRRMAARDDQPPEPRRALQVYRRRWGIERLFGDTKTRGLNLEDTHLTHPAKIEAPTAVPTLAITWIYRTATAAMGLKAIARKTHGRREKSWFRTGPDALRNAILNAPNIPAAIWAERCPKRLRPL